MRRVVNKVSILALFLTLVAYIAQGQSIAPACEECEQEALFFDGEVATHFDNAEYAGNDIGNEGLSTKTDNQCQHANRGNKRSCVNTARLQHQNDDRNGTGVFYKAIKQG